MSSQMQTLESFMAEPAPCDNCGFKWHCKTNNVMCRSFLDYVLEPTCPIPPIISYTWPRIPDRPYGQWRRER